MGGYNGKDPYLVFLTSIKLVSAVTQVLAVKLQVMAIKWILGNLLQSCKEPLIILKLLTLCHYVELHDLLFFVAITCNEFDNLTNFKTIEDERTRQHCRSELKIENN